jgi:predicted nucleic acid-binding protein
VIVIADTTPLNYLAMIGRGDILKELYGTVIVPPAVRRELNHPRTPAIVREWLSPWPSWLHVPNTPLIVRNELLALGAGESEAIALALQTGNAQILMDDADGRRMAESFSLRVIGTLGILRDAARENLVDLKTTVWQVRAAGLFVSDEVIASIGLG